jgi:prepilin-type N-terminal cleavage/methylation domain-containing protein
MRPRRHRGARLGFTLLEMAVAMAVLGIVLGAVGVFQVRSQDQSRVMMASGVAENRAWRAIDRAANELVGVGASVLAPNPTSNLGTSILTFQKPNGVSGTGAITWAPAARLELQMDSGETNNGSDDDDDGLIDERRLVLVRDIGTADQTTVVLCSGVAEWLEGEAGNGSDDNGNGLVDEAGFSIRRVGDLLFLRLTVQQPLGGGELVETTAETTVVLRN